MSEKKKMIFRSPVESTQQNVPVRDIYKGMIITKDDRYLKILEIRPVPFTLYTSYQQMQTALMYMDAVAIAPHNFQIITMTLPANMKEQIEDVEEHIRNERYDACIAIGNEYKRALLQAAKTTVTRRYFIVIEHEKTGGYLYRESLDDALIRLNALAESISHALESCELKVVEAPEGNDSLQAAEIIYSFYNRRENGKVSFMERYASLCEKYILSGDKGQEQFYIPPAEYIAPQKMGFMDRKYAVINDIYYTFLYIPSDGYSIEKYAGWLYPFITAYDGVDVSMYYNKVDKEIVQNQIRQNMNWNLAEADDVSSTSMSFDAASLAADSANYLRKGMNDGEDFFWTSVMITVTGSSPYEVDSKISELKRIAQINNLKLAEIQYETEQAFISSLPLGYLDKRIFNKAKRNMLSSGVAGMFPFSTYELNDPKGIQIGYEVSNNSVVSLDLHERDRYSNGNVFVSGISGSGKTYTLLLMALRMRVKNIPVYMIVPEKDHEYWRAVKAVGGQRIILAPESGHCINIMEIRKMNEAANQFLYEEGESVSYLIAKINKVKTFMTMVDPDLSVVEMQYLDSALLKTYLDKGITEDNSSLIDPEHPEQFKESPTLQDLYSTLQNYPDLKRTRTILRTYVKGSYKTFGGQTNVNLDNPFTVISVAKLNDRMLPIVLYIIFDYMMPKITEDSAQKKALFCDEFWKVAKNEAAAADFMKLAKLVRGFGGSLIMATQQLRDFFQVNNGIFGEQIINNCNLKMLLQNEHDDAKNLEKFFNLSSVEVNRILKFRRGTLLLLAGGDKVTVQVKATETEDYLVTTDTERIKRYKSTHNDDYSRKENKVIVRNVSLPELVSTEDDLIYDLEDGTVYEETDDVYDLEDDSRDISEETVFDIEAFSSDDAG